MGTSTGAGPGPGPFDGCPEAWLEPTDVLYRVHKEWHEPWYFAPRATAMKDSGRWDLPSPWGTCYLAEVQRGAFVEVVGRQTHQIDLEDVAERRISALSTPDRVRLADVFDPGWWGCAGVAAGIGGERGYAVTHPLAERLHRAGFCGVRYRLRRDPDLAGVALFGPRYLRSWPVRATEPISDDLVWGAARRYRMKVLP